MITATISTPRASLALDELLEAIRERVECGERLRSGTGGDHEFSDYLALVRVEEDKSRAFCAAVADGIRAEKRGGGTGGRGWVERVRAELDGDHDRVLTS